MLLDSQIIGRSKHVVQLRKQVARLAGRRDDVFVIGEPGVGKTTMALLIAGNDSPITINLSREAETDSLLSRIVDGTVILEGLEDAGFRIQDQVVKFLSSRPEGVRVIAILSDRPAELLKIGKVQEVLCETTTGFERVEILPLRERPEDIPLLVKQFAGGLVIDINSLEMLVKLPWNENVRQLKALVERCVASANDGRVMLPAELVDERTEVAKIVGDLMGTERPALESSLDVIEGSIIRRTLERFGFNESKSAEFLGMTEHSFGEKVRRLALAKAGS